MQTPNNSLRDPSEPAPPRPPTTPPLLLPAVPLAATESIALRDHDDIVAAEGPAAETRDDQAQQDPHVQEGHLPREPAESMLHPPSNEETPAQVEAVETAGPEGADLVNGSAVELRGGRLDVQDARESPAMVSSPRSEKDAPPVSPAVAQKRKVKEVSISENSPEIIHSQRSIVAYRERLARDLERREQAVKGPPVSGFDKTNVSPIREELAMSPTTSGSDLLTASTESAKTIRGGTTPGPVARTPSYPFPRMNSFTASSLSRAFNPQSQTPLLRSAGGQFESTFLHDQLRSDPSTPASAMTFQPAGFTQAAQRFDYPTPNLYELALMLGAEPGIDAWWNSVVQIMTENYKAERITLSMAADATDIYNVPWGQKATYNAHEEDELSMAYMARGSSMVPSSIDDLSETPGNLDENQRSEKPPRPDIQSRHSFTTFEDKQESRKVQAGEAGGSAAASRRPAPIMRSKSYFPMVDRHTSSSPHPPLNKETLEEHDAVEEEQQIPSWEAPLVSNREVKGRVLPVLQALDLEADPLIDHNGIQRVVERGKVIALTRNYPYLDQEAEKGDETKPVPAPPPEEVKKKAGKPPGAASGLKLSSLLSNATASHSIKRHRKLLSTERTKMASLLSAIDDLPPRPPTPKYEEYEQAPPSPWSQSPAPSPAVRADPTENPFFMDAVVDEESFNPGPSPQDYTSMQTPETIGVDNSWTVLHVPLNHIFLSKSTTQPFKLDSSALEEKNSLRNPSQKIAGVQSERTPSPSLPENNRRPPIAILSMLTPVIPYPSNLRHSLEHLAPHLATSFNLCRHYTSLETEVAGLRRRRPTTAGFGGVDPEGRPLTDPAIVSHLNITSPDVPSQLSVTGSLTSPSDYSGPSRSVPNSQGGTPTWEPGSFGLIVDRRTPGASPGPVGGESYFNARPRSQGVSADQSTQRTPVRGTKDTMSLVDKHHRRSSSLKVTKTDSVSAPLESELSDTARRTSDEIVSPRPVPGSTSKSPSDTRNKIDEQRPQQEMEQTRKRISSQGVPSQNHRHSVLHSYGGDFATTFQSLPPSTSLFTKPTTSTPALPLTGAGAVSMLPPSDRLKSLMLDTLPVHVFVALPNTGEIVWVNSRYLVYRGQTVADLVADPWGSLHADDRDEYLQAWSQSLRTGDTFDRVVRLRRFDGAYRWHQARAITSRDKRGVIVQFIGSYMDIHDQHIAKLKAVHQHEIEASEAKHRLLANLIPQIIFTATEEDGITFANEQWLAYTGQSSESCLGLGFIDSVHPDDIAKCHIPTSISSATSTAGNGMDTPLETPSATAGKRPLFNSTPRRSSAAQTPMDTTPKAPSRDSVSGGNSLPDLTTTDLSELAKKGIIKVTTDSNGRLSYTTELRLRSKTGEYRWHLIRCVEIDNIDFVGNGASSFFGSATDINDHKLLEAKLKEAMESKGRFLSNMSHEIRTPLIGISGMVSFLQDTTLNEEQRDFTNTIQTSANSLLMIINDILDLSKVDAGMMKLKYEWFHTRSLIEDVNELVSTMAIAKRLELNYIVEENVPSWVKGDKVRIRQVLLNVIGNAIKFTAQGEVFSRCRVISDKDSKLDENQIMLEFSIIDTGRGFSKEEAELIFKPFSQIDGSSTRQHGGSGLGLVISRQLVELHGGQMDGTAQPGKGSTFTFSAKFGLPSAADHPSILGTPPMTASAQPPAVDKPLPVQSFLLQKAMDVPPHSSPNSDLGPGSPAFTSSAESDPSVRSLRTTQTARSSVSSVNAGLVRFSEAAKASGQDLSQMKLEMPSGKVSPQITPMGSLPNPSDHPTQFRPPVYSILVICPQRYSREAITKHIEMTLPKDTPYQMTTMASVSEAKGLIGGQESVTFTHIVLNLGSAEEVMEVIDQCMGSPGDKTSVLVLSDSVQRQAVLKLTSGPKYQQFLAEKRVNFIFKPVKPSRFAVIFDPGHERDWSIDLNRSSAAQMVESQKQNYIDVEKRIGNKGYRVLLVEDNPVNQKVLVRYLKKVGIDAEIAIDGVECTEKVFSHGPNYYSLILCDLHMPRKDGYQACREIRQWETDGNHTKIPIIALSANVMSDVQDKCTAAGFSDYVTKPVDFGDLSKAMSKYF